MNLLDGKKAAQAIKDELKIDVAQLATEGKKIPHLVAILVGNNGASETYVAAKVKACEEVGLFGGREGFIKTQENDRKKRELCTLNNCYLIEVLPNYNIEEVLSQIKSIIQIRG